MDKIKLREHYLLRREKLDPKTRQLYNEKIKHQFLAYFNDLKIEVIHTFLPIAERNEIDTMSLLDALKIRNPKLKIIVSKSNFKTFEMTSYLLREDTIFKINRWGIPEPVEGVLFDEIKIDMILIPLVIFDKMGHRVGYGKGFYDRFLKKCRPAALKVGLCLEPPIRSIPDTHEFDVTLNYCVTPDQVYAFY